MDDQLVKRAPSDARTEPAAPVRHEGDGDRADGEPLEASWRPEPESADAKSAKKPSALSKLVATYGWRIYALPVLMVLTVLVAVDMARSDEPIGSGSDENAPPADGRPAATEQAAVNQNLKVPTADLPDGGKYTQTGKGSWKIVEHKGGDGEVVGKKGQLYKYAVEVERGIDAASFGGDQAFASVIDATLADKRGWTSGSKVRLQRVNDPDDADFRISLTTPKTDHQLCGYVIKFEASCYARSDASGGASGTDANRVVINLARWVRGAKAFSGDMISYRQYAINHEVGHALGNGHVACERDGDLAPVMMQQTFGVANDYVAKLNGEESGPVPKDGKICKPNAWPNPSAR